MSLRSFLSRIEQEKEILYIKDEVSADLEVSFVMKQFDSNGPILRFEKVEACNTKIVANVCGTRDRICKALRTNRNDLNEKLLNAWRSPQRPRIISNGAANETIENSVDLSKIPILKHFELDAGKYLTSGVVHAKSVDGEVENASIHRLQVLDKNHVAIRMVPRHLFHLWRMARERGRDLDVSISFGVHPAVMLAASSPLVLGVDEFDVANSLLDGHLRLINCRKIDAYAPSDAEIVLEGRISTSKEAIEGPFVDVTGTYDIQRRQPVVEIVGIMHRDDYEYEALLPGGAEHRLLMGLPREALIWEAVSKVVPNVFSVNLSEGGCGWLHAVISIEKQVDGDAKNALLAAFAAHPSLKHVVAVDSDINVADVAEVEWAIATRFQASEDLVFVNNVRGSTLDSSANQETGLTTKLGVDATRPLSKPKEKFERAKIPGNRRVKTLVGKLQGLRE